MYNEENAGYEVSEKRLTKRAIILYVLNILKLYSSPETTVTQSVIANYLNDIGLSCDRKTVGRNIGYLIEFGYPILRVRGKGYYLDREKLGKSENKLVI